MRPFLPLLLALLAAPLHAQTVRYVDADAAGADDGSSWADAFRDLQDALTAAQPGDEVWVAEGVYRPTDGADRDATFHLRNGVALYGGFAGTETGRDQRDWAAHETVLSGDVGTPGDDLDNSYHVVTGSGAAATAVLDGFTVTAARADGLYPRNRGGGMRNVAGSPTVRHCVFRENVASLSPDGRAAFGAGMFNEAGSRPLLEDVRFERNASVGGSGLTGGVGGGMANRASHPTLRGVVFLENEALSLGGGMTNDTGSSPLLVDVRFERNRSGGWTGGMDNYQNAHARLFNVVFLGNVAEHYGGGMTNDTGGDVLLVNVLFVGNVARNRDGEAGAAGLQNNGSSPTLVGVTFSGNTAADGAGGFGHRDGGAPVLRDVILWGDGDELVDETGAGLDLAHALVEGGYPGGTVVLDADPLFARPPSPGPDGLWGTADDDYGDLRLRPGSPALDAGDAAHLPADAADLDGDGDTAEAVPLDLAGGARVQAAALDLGAYEGATVVAAEPPAAPTGLLLRPVFPNPARGAVTIPFALGAPARVSLFVTDVLGREVARLADAPFASGTHATTWAPEGVAAGLYFVVLATAHERAVQPLLFFP